MTCSRFVVPLAAIVLVACGTARNTQTQPTPQPPTQGAAPTAAGQTAVPTELQQVPEVAPTTGEGATLAVEATSTGQAVAEVTATSPATLAPSTTPTATVTVDAPADNTLAITHGPISGEVTDTTAVLWARAGMTGTLRFSVTVNRSGAVATVLTAPVDGVTDYTGKVRVEGLEPATVYSYAVTLESDGSSSRPAIGEFTTAPLPGTPAALNFVMGADIGGQGYCRDEQSGYRIFGTMLQQEPEFFLMLGDGVYVDTACAGENNVPGSEGPFRTLTGFRNRYKYTLADAYYAEFLAQTPTYATWDDHEVIDDFGGPELLASNPELFLEGRQAFFEFWALQGPVDNPFRIYRSFSRGAHADFFVLDTRSFRDPNVNWDPNPSTLLPKTMLGTAQKDWLKQGLDQSEATWKFIITSVPLSYPTGFPQPQIDGRDGWANYTEQSGYETELAEILYFIKSHGITNVVFLTADVHWPFVMTYDPDRDGATDFYEFGSGPLSAITLPPTAKPDPTFNPTVLYSEGTFQGDLFNFGQVTISEDGSLSFRIVDRQGVERFAIGLEPEG